MGYSASSGSSTSGGGPSYPASDGAPLNYSDNRPIRESQVSPETYLGGSKFDSYTNRLDLGLVPQRSKAQYGNLVDNVMKSLGGRPSRDDARKEIQDSMQRFGGRRGISSRCSR